MQPYCIYAEAFAGLFRPLRAPEPPFTHKTPPFTQVLFLFDAFYGTISLRKPSSLCSYKTESEAPMKKRILALLLAFSMMLSLLPVSALADTGGGIGSAGYASNEPLPDLVMDNDTGRPYVSQIEPDPRGNYQGNGWMYNEKSDALMLKSGKYDFNYTSPRYRTGDHLNCVNVNRIDVQPSATIVGGMFNGQSLSNYGTVENSLLSTNDIESGGTMTNWTNCLFKCSNPPVGVANCHKLTEVNNSKFEATLLNAPSGFTGCETYYFTGTPTLKVKLSSNEEITCINGDEHYGGLRPSDVSGYYTFTPKAGDDVVLNRKPYVTDLVMTTDGIPDTTGREPVYENGKVVGYKGTGWKYEIIDSSHSTLTLESGSYDFSTTKPTTQNGDVLKLVNCKVVVENGATITGGHFRAMSNYGTVKNSLLSSNDIENCDGGTMTNCLFSRSTPPKGVADYHKLTEVNNSTFDATLPNAPYIFSSCKTYYFTGTPKLVVKLAKLGGDFDELHYINGRVDYGGLTGPDSGYYTFTPEKEEDILLNDSIIHEPFTMTNGYPTASNGGKTACKGEDWKYENGTLTLESGDYDFSTNGLGQLAPDVKLVVGPNAKLTGGVFNEKPEGLTTDNVQTISLNGSGSIEAVNDLSSAKWSKTLYAIKDSQVEIKADTEITNINGWDIGKFPGSSYPNGADDKTTVRFRMPNGPVVLNDTLYTLDIIRGTMLGNTSVSVPAGTELILEADEPAKNETFLGWTLSDESLLTKGTLNDPECKTITIKMNNASATAEAVFQKDTPAYTLTVTGGGLVNDKTSAVVEAGDEVCLTVGEIQDGMSFNYWDLPTALTQALTDSSSGGFSNKVEPLTFTMPDLSEYTKDTRFTIRLDIRPAELPDDDDGPSVLGTMATVAVGGAAAGILVWQGVSLGVDSYLQLSLPGGVPVPTNRRELVVLLWETAGKPDVVLPALYGDVSAEDGELQKATRWAIDNGLVKPADETDASRFDPDRSVSKYEVARAWFKVQQMLK